MRTFDPSFRCPGGCHSAPRVPDDGATGERGSVFEATGACTGVEAQTPLPAIAPRPAGEPGEPDGAAPQANLPEDFVPAHWRAPERTA